MSGRPRNFAIRFNVEPLALLISLHNSYVLPIYVASKYCSPFLFSLFETLTLTFTEIQQRLLFWGGVGTSTIIVLICLIAGYGGFLAFSLLHFADCVLRAWDLSKIIQLDQAESSDLLIFRAQKISLGYGFKISGLSEISNTKERKLLTCTRNWVKYRKIIIMKVMMGNHKTM